MAKSTSLVPASHVTERIVTVRGQRVIINAYLAALYGVPTHRLNEQVKRNQERFPRDFMFQKRSRWSSLPTVCLH
jgi:hypothetical protein